MARFRGRLKRVSCNERIGFSTPPFNERIRVSEIGRDFSNVLLFLKEVDQKLVIFLQSILFVFRVDSFVNFKV